MLTNLRAFKAENIQASEDGPEKVKLTDLRFNKTIFINYSAGSPSTQNELVEWYLKKLNIDLEFQAWHEKKGVYKYSIYLTNNFSTKLK